jgi:hypothetical protein
MPSNIISFFRFSCGKAKQHQPEVAFAHDNIVTTMSSSPSPPFQITATLDTFQLRLMSIPPDSGIICIAL